MKKVAVHPDYAFCSAYIACLPNIFNEEGQTIYKSRNELKVFEHQGLEFVVKSFKTPHLLNQAVYTTLRASKAKRSFDYALMLKDKGVATPSPVAYIEIKKCGLLFQSFFVSEKSRFHHEIRVLSTSPDWPEAHIIITEFARFTADLHSKGVFHKDYSPGNILFGKIDDHYAFELVDLNRMKFGKVTLQEGCNNLNRLGLNEELYQLLLREYIAARGLKSR